MTDGPADAIAAWHDELGGGLGVESAEWLAARQRERGLMFGERPLCTVVRPRFFRQAEYDALQATAAELLAAFRILGEAAFVDPAIRAQLRLTDWEETLLETAPRLDTPSPLSRLDLFLDPVTRTPRLTEFNAETPAGTAYCDVLAELFEGMPGMRPFVRRWVIRPLPGRPHLGNTLLDCWHRFRGVRTLPTIAIVDWADVPTLAEFRHSRDWFERMGCRTLITTPDALEYDGTRLRAADGTVIDLVYKRVLIHELIAEGGLSHPLVRAVVDGNVCLVNPFACKPLHKKASLAVLSDERNAALFPAGTRAAIARHIPWTRVVEPRHTEVDGARVDLLPWIVDHRDDLVLKPNDDYGGAGIVLGWEVDAGAWASAVQRATESPFVVQRRIGLPREPFPAVQDGALVFDDRIVDTAPFCWDGARMDGVLTRISTSTLVNVTAGGGSTVPTFVVEPR